MDFLTNISDIDITFNKCVECFLKYRKKRKEEIKEGKKEQNGFGYVIN